LTADAGMKRKNLIRSHMAVQWPRTVRRAAGFCVQPKRFLPFFVTDLLAITAAFLLLGSLAMPLGEFAAGYVPPEIIPALGGLTAVFMGWSLATLWITGAVIHQSSKPKEFSKSWSVSTSRFPNLFAASVVMAIISLLASSVPGIGLLLSAIASMAFLLVSQFIIVGGTGFCEALTKSVKAFRYKFPAVFLAWLFCGVLSVIIVLIFALPLLATVSYYIAQYGLEDAMLYMLVYLDWNVLYAEAGILLLGMSVSRVFLLHFLTGVYQQLHRKRFFIF
jgi:hypothetical protein